MTGRELRDKRERAGVRARDIAVYFDRHPAAITHLERRDEVEPLVAKRYLRALAAIRGQRIAVRRDLIRELAAR